MKRRGLFISFEGPEGSGKTTQTKIFSERLRKKGYSVLNLREPGGTKTGELIREILQHERSGEKLDYACEMLLFEAARAQLTSRTILPALERGEYVVCDRFFDSTTAYQGYGRGLDKDKIKVINLFASNNLVPDLTFICDIPVDIGFERIKKNGRKPDRIEREGIDFHERIRKGYLEIAREEPRRFYVVDASLNESLVAEKIWEEFSKRFF